MGSKGQIPPHHLRRPLPGPGLVHPDPSGPGNLPHPGPFPPFDMLPPPEVLEQKIAAQHVEMQRLSSENQRIAATHGTLRRELAAAQHELQILRAQIGAITSEREKQMQRLSSENQRIAATHGTLRRELAAAQHELQILRAQIGAITSEREKQMQSLTEKINKMEAELEAAEPVKIELQKAHTEAQNLVLAREELMYKVHQLSQDLHRAHVDMQQLPALMAEFESLRQEYHHCRATFDYEKKFYNDHLESLKVMEKNYINMARELDKLRAELMNTTNVDSRIVGQYGVATVNNENGASGHPVGQNAYEVGYGIYMRHGPLPSAPTGAGEGAGVYVGAQSGPIPARTGYEMSGGAGYDASRGTAYESHRFPGYGANDASGNATFDAPAITIAPPLPPPHGQTAIPDNGPYGSATASAHAGGAYEAPPQAGNCVR